MSMDDGTYAVDVSVPVGRSVFVLAINGGEVIGSDMCGGVVEGHDFARAARDATSRPSARAREPSWTCPPILPVARRSRSRRYRQ
jgi:hypothetical protein